MCVCVCVRVRACLRACACVCSCAACGLRQASLQLTVCRIGDASRGDILVVIFTCMLGCMEWLVLNIWQQQAF